MNLARIAICAAALTALSAPSVQAAPARLARTVDLRQGPGSGYPVIAVIPLGSLVDIGGCQRRWCAVAWRGWTGYAPARFYPAFREGRRPAITRRRAGNIRATGPITVPALTPPTGGAGIGEGIAPL